jgi:hypothetical protein
MSFSSRPKNVDRFCAAEIGEVCYDRLLAAGNVKKVALTACMHKCLTILNAMLKPRTPWKPQEVQN